MKKKLLSTCAIFSLAMSLNYADAKMSIQSNKLYNSAIVQEQEGNYQRALDYIQKALQYSPDDAVLNIKLAGLQANLGNYEDAITAYNKAIMLRNDDGFLYISLANLYAQQYDYQNALKAYEKAQILMPEYKYNHINIANLKSLLKDPQGAIESYNNFLKEYPNNLEALCAIASVYLEEQDYEKAVENFALALRTNPKDFRDYSNYGLALLRKEDFPKAEIAFKSAVGINPSDSMSYANLGVTQMKQGNIDDALSSLKKALEIDNELHVARYDYAKLLTLKNQKAKAVEQYELFIEHYPEMMSAYVELAKIYENTDNLEDAIGVLNKALEVKADDSEIKFNIARLYQNNAEFDSALKYYNEILSSNKSNPLALYNVAVIKTQMGKYQEAAMIYSALLKTEEETLAQNDISLIDIQKDSYENQIKMAQNHLEKGETKKAKSIFNKLLETTTDDYRLYLGLADCSFAQGMNMFAKNYYEQALNLDNTNVEALTRYAQALYELKDYDLSLAILDKIIELNPQDDKSYYNKALINYEQKSYDIAREELINALNAKPTVADYHYLLGMILEAQGNSKDAIVAYEMFLQFSTDETLKEKIKSKTKAMYDGVK